MTLAAIPADVAARCPFCRGERVRVHEWSSHGKHFAVICLTSGCEARGPRRYDAAAAVDAWNERER